MTAWVQSVHNTELGMSNEDSASRSTGPREGQRDFGRGRHSLTSRSTQVSGEPVVVSMLLRRLDYRVSEFFEGVEREHPLGDAERRVRLGLSAQGGAGLRVVADDRGETNLRSQDEGQVIKAHAHRLTAFWIPAFRSAEQPDSTVSVALRMLAAEHVVPQSELSQLFTKPENNLGQRIIACLFEFANSQGSTTLNWVARTLVTNPSMSAHLLKSDSPRTFCVRKHASESASSGVASTSAAPPPSPASRIKRDGAESVSGDESSKWEGTRVAEGRKKWNA